MAQVDLRIAMKTRWFFVPALLTLAVLHRLGILQDMDKSTAWLAEHGIKWRAG
jgi:hypothetical protein